LAARLSPCLIYSWAYDQNLSADRNKVERLFGRLKKARFATRHEKTVTSFLAVAHLLAALDGLR